MYNPTKINIIINSLVFQRQVISKTIIPEIIKTDTNVSYLECTTHDWYNLHQVC